MSNDELVVCRVCAQSWSGAKAGQRCPTGDGGVLIDLSVHHAMPTDHFIGHAIAGKYAVVGKLGGGAMGAVYRALQEPVGRAVAIKVIAADAAMEGDLRARFFREARAVAQLSSPSVVTLYDYGQTEDGTLFMAFELLDGELLGQLIQREGRIAPARAVALLEGVLSALTEAHALGLVHRDLKPDNVMVLRDRLGRETVKVLDFGIAKMRDAENDGVHTREGIVLGTPRYMSPEQAQDKALDGRSDLYAVGVILYEMLAGRPPYDGVAPLDVLLAHVREPIPPLPVDVPVSAAMRALILRAMAKDREQRYPSAETLLQAMHEALAAPVGPAAAVSAPPAHVPAMVAQVAGSGPHPVLTSGAQVAARSSAPGRSQPLAAARSGALPARGAVLSSPQPAVKKGGGAAKFVALAVVAAALGGGGYWWMTREAPKSNNTQPANSSPVTVSITPNRTSGADAQQALIGIEALLAEGQSEKAQQALELLLKSSPDRAKVHELLKKREALQGLLEALPAELRAP